MKNWECFIHLTNSYSQLIISWKPIILLIPTWGVYSMIFPVLGFRHKIPIGSTTAHNIEARKTRERHGVCCIPNGSATFTPTGGENSWRCRNCSGLHKIPNTKRGQDRDFREIPQAVVATKRSTNDLFHPQSTKNDKQQNLFTLNCCGTLAKLPTCGYSWVCINVRIV